MKKNAFYLFRHLSFLFFSLVITACFDSCKDDPDPELKLSSSSVSIDPYGGEANVGVTSNLEWKIDDIESWLTVTPASGKNNQEVTLKASANETDSPRSATLLFCSTDGKLTQVLKVEQNNVNVNLSASPTQVDFEFYIGDEKHFTVDSNLPWKITNQPNWIDINPTAGNGNGVTAVTLKTTKENNTSEPVTCDLNIQAGNKTVTVTLTQANKYTSNCRTTPKTFLAMCYGAATDFSYSKNVAYFDFAFMEKNEADKYSNDELADYLSTASITQRKTVNEDWVTSTTDLYTYENRGADFYVVTVSYESNNNRGEIVKYPFSTKPYVNVGEVWADNLGLASSGNNYYVVWDMVGNSYVDTYYTWTSIGKNKFMTFTKGDYLVGWFIYQEIKNNSNSHNTSINSGVSYEHLEGPQVQLGENINNAPFNLEDNYIQIVSWAKDRNGELSGTLNNWTIDLLDSEARAQTSVDKYHNNNNTVRPPLSPSFESEWFLKSELFE